MEINKINYKEALERIKHNDCEEYCMNGKGNCAECRWGVAIAALEKQVPKVPLHEWYAYADDGAIIDTWICPNCGAGYEIECHTYAYCPNCGQAIDWEVEK